MLAVDTNVVVCFVVTDDDAQAARARRLVDEEDVFVCNTVLLEAEWVLKSVYRYSPLQIAEFLRSLAGLPSVTVENPGALARALEWVEAGALDFADSLHIAQAEECDAFITFDRPLIRLAGKLKTLPVRAP